MNRFGPEQKMHFVAIDDNRSVLTLLRAQLQHQGHSIDTTTDPEEILQKLKAPNKVDGLLSDYEIGEVNGISLARRVRAEALYTGPIALITGNVDIEDIERGNGEADIQAAYKEGLIIDVVKKPFRMAALQRAIDKMRKFKS